MDNLDGLILRILDDIALCGSRGAGIADVRKYVEAFYYERSKTGASSTSAQRAQHVDAKFQTQVWVWLNRHADAHISSACNSSASPEDLLFGQCTCDASNADDPSAAVERPQGRPLRKCLRVSTSEERVWMAVAGHGPDPEKVPGMDFVCLVAIAARREEGILQPDLVRLTGQDKRSVPVRTQRLAERGYIVKESVSVRARTSRLVLKRFHGAPGDGQAVRRVETNAGVRMIFEQGYYTGSKNNSSRLETLAKGLVRILDEHQGLSYATLRSKLNDQRLGSSQSLLMGVINILEHMGHIQQVKPPGALPGQDGLPARRINLTYSLTDEDWQDFAEFAAQFPSRFSHGNIDLERDEEYRYVNEDDLENGSHVRLPKTPNDDSNDGEASAFPPEGAPPIPRWTPTQPLVNLIYETTNDTSTAGASHVQMQQQAVGRFFRRPLEHTISRLVDFWQVSQPSHLRHLAVVRDAAQVGRIGVFMHYTYGNFAAKARAGNASWEFVRTMRVADAPADTEPTGFPVLPAEYFASFKHGADLGACLQDTLKNLPRASKVKRPPSAAKAKADPRAKPRKTPLWTYDEQMLAISRPSTGVFVGQRVYLYKDVHRGRPPVSQLAVFKSPRLREMNFPGLELRTETLSAESSSPDQGSVLLQSSRTSQSVVGDVGDFQRASSSSLALAEATSSSVHQNMPQGPVTQEPKQQDSVPNEPSATGTDEVTLPRTKRYYGPRKRRRSDTSATPARKRSLRKTDDHINAVDSSAQVEQATVQPANSPIELIQNGRRPSSSLVDMPLANVPSTGRLSSASPSPANGLELLKTFQAQPTPLRPSSSQSADGPIQPGDNEVASHLLRGHTSSADPAENGVVTEDQPTEPYLALGEQHTGSPDTPCAQDPLGESTQMGTCPASERPKEPAIETTPNKQRSRRIIQFGGSIAAARRKLFLDIIRDCGGVFPGDREIWFPFATRWMLQSQNAKPDQRTVRQVRKSLIDNGKLRQVIFAFPNRHGASITKSILTLPDVAPSDQRVIDLRKRMIERDPDYYFPAAMGEIRPELRPRTLAQKVEKLRNFKRDQAADPDSDGDALMVGQGAMAVLDFSPATRQPDQLEQLSETSPSAHPTKRVKLSKSNRPLRPSNSTNPGQASQQGTPGAPKRCPHTATLPDREAPLGVLFMPALGVHNDPKRDFKETLEPCAECECESRYLDETLESMRPPGVGKVLMNNAPPLTPRRRGRARKELGPANGTESRRNLQSSQNSEPASNPRHPGPLRPLQFPELSGHPQPVRDFLPPSDQDVGRLSKASERNKTPVDGYSNAHPHRPPWPRQAPAGSQNGAELQAANYALGFAMSSHAAGLITAEQQLIMGYPTAISSQRLASIGAQRPGDPGTQQTNGFQPLRPAPLPAHREAAAANATFPDSGSRPTREGMVPSFFNRKLGLPGSKAARLESLLSKPKILPKTRDPQIDKGPVKRVRIRGPTDGRFEGHEGDVRVAVAVIIVRTVTGGLERAINWELVARILGTAPNREFFSSRWARIRTAHRPLVDKQTREFQNLFLQRYRSGDMPALDYNKVEEFDWEGLYTWALDQLCFPQSSQPVLPADRKSLERTYTLKHSSRTAIAEVFEIKQSVSIPRRHAIMHVKPSVLSLPIRTVKEPPDDRLAVARNYIRAIVMTPEAAYNPQVARMRLASLEPVSLSGPLQDMVNSRIIAVEASGRSVSGRGYGISEHFLARFITNLEPPDFVDAAAFKNACRRLFEGNAPSGFDPFATNGVVLSVIDMAAARHVKMHQKELPLKRFGLTKGGYRTKHMDLSVLNFEVELGPSQTFPADKPLAKLPPIPRSSVPSDKDLALVRFPLWIDINGDELPVIWRLVLAAVVNILVARPGTTVEDLVEGLGPGIEAFDIQLVVAWLVEAKAASWLGRGQRAARLRDWWWMVFEEDETTAMYGGARQK